MGLECCGGGYCIVVVGCCDSVWWCFCICCVLVVFGELVYCVGFVVVGCWIWMVCV